VPEVDRAYDDALLASTYDAENAARDDIEFYLALAVELDVHDVTDLGCGTGVLAADLAAAGHAVIGIDPADAMLDIARTRVGGERVTWRLGDSAALDEASADLIVMTGHVAQVFVDEDYWRTTLRRCFGALRPGGHLAFETRNPERRSWTDWTRERTTGRYTTADGISFTSWVQVTDVTDDLVTFDAHNVFTATGEDIVSASTLRFRSRPEIESALADAGFGAPTVYGDWDRSSVTGNSPELIFVATKAA
jgi:SAM-dependent methyltransferase